MEALQTFLTQYSGMEAYIVFFFLSIACCVGLFNSDITFITAGALSSIQFFDYRILIALGFFALLIGDSITFFAGRKWGSALIQIKPFSFVLNDEKMNAAESFLQKKGVIFVFFVRFLPLLRTALFLTAGSLRVKPKTFYALNALSTLIYLPLVIIGSKSASANAHEIVANVKRLQFIPILFLGTVVLFFYLKNSRAKKEGAI